MLQGHVQEATTVGGLLFSPAGAHDQWISLTLVRNDASTFEVSHHGAYSSKEHASYVGNFFATFLRDIISARRFFTHEDASEAFTNAHNALLRRLAQGWL